LLRLPYDLGVASHSRIEILNVISRIINDTAKLRMNGWRMGEC